MHDGRPGASGAAIPSTVPTQEQTVTDQTARTLTPNEHDRAWHAIEGGVGEDGADPGTVLAAVLHALNINAPSVEDEQAASPRLRDAARQAAEPPVVAYRDPHNPRVLLCRQHGQSWHAITPVTAEDLPEGGICTFGRLSSNECGRDVLAAQPAAVLPCFCRHAKNGHSHDFPHRCLNCSCVAYSPDAGQPAVEQPAEAQPGVRNVIEHALTVYYQDSSAPSAVARAILSQHRAEILREGIEVARAEGMRLEEQIGIEAARGARCVAYLLRRMAEGPR